MSTDDSKAGGLFSKVVRFVRHPSASWSEGEAPDEPLDQVDRQVLRQTLERKRRNDLVRQREFEQLRLLRQKQGASDGEAQAGASSQPSSAHSSLMPPDTRAVTLQKIDAIEEQMSQQWWRKKQPADASTMPMYLVSTFPQPDSVHFAAAPRAPAVPGPAPDAALDWNVDTGGMQAPGPAGAHDGGALSTTFATTMALDSADWSAPAHLPSASGPFVHDPDFEEAAIGFANGDAAGAETALLALLAQRAAQPEVQYPVWFALFDLYRASGLPDRFDELAIDFATHFGRSAPLWFSMAEPGASAPGAAMPVAQQDRAHDWRWNAPHVLTRQSVTALQLGKMAAPAPWTLFWGALERIEADAVEPLERVFTEWAQTPGLLVFLDAPVLAQCLQALTVSGDREVPEARWRLRMAALRLMDQHDSFELVALDYCVTYEVSPPSWVAPRSSYRDELEGVPPEDTPPEAPPLAAHAGLAGSFDGDATPWLEALEVHMRPGKPLAVDCAELVRMDFAATGSVLNWAARMQAEGVALRFERLHQLVAVFFDVVGVGEHAQLVPRTD